MMYSIVRTLKVKTTMENIISNLRFLVQTIQSQVITGLHIRAINRTIPVQVKSYDETTLCLRGRAIMLVVCHHRSATALGIHRMAYHAGLTVGF